MSPKIELFWAYPKAQVGFGDAVKTEVMAVRTSKEHTLTVDLALSQISQSHLRVRSTSALFKILMSIL